MLLVYTLVGHFLWHTVGLLIYFLVLNGEYSFVDDLEVKGVNVIAWGDGPVLYVL